MVFADYLTSVTEEMKLKSARIKAGFKTHNLSAGENREDLVKHFLCGHLPQRFSVSSGLILSSDGVFSNQADLIIADGFHNSPLYAKQSNELWPIEAVYSLIEVKTTLDRPSLEDAIKKGRNFKKLPRQFLDVTPMKITDSLFIIWGYSSTAPETLKENLEELLREVPTTEQPDLIIIPGEMVVQAGTYRELTKLGQPASEHRQKLEKQYGGDLTQLLKGQVDVWLYKENSLLTWYIWLDSWLRRAGGRFTDPVRYIPPNIHGVLQN